MARNKINYQFIPMPLHIFMCMDNNCRSTLAALIQLSTYYETKNGAAFDGWFFRTNALLEEETNLSKNVLSGALDALYRAGIIDIKSQEKGRGKKQGSRSYKVKYDSFLRYESIPLEECSCDNPDFGIVTSDYKKGTPLFQQRPQLEEQPKRGKSDNNIENIYNTEILDIIDKKTIKNIDKTTSNSIEYSSCHFEDESGTRNEGDLDGVESHPSNNGQNAFQDNLNPVPSTPSTSEDFIISQIPFVYSKVRREGDTQESDNYTEAAYDILDEYGREVKNWIGCIQANGRYKNEAAARLLEVINGQEYRSQRECEKTALDLMKYAARCDAQYANEIRVRVYN